MGSCNIVFNGQDEAIRMIPMIFLSLVYFSDLTEEYSRKEGKEGFSLAYWSSEHKRFFTEMGTYPADIELVIEEFERVNVL